MPKYLSKTLVSASALLPSITFAHPGHTHEGFHAFFHFIGLEHIAALSVAAAFLYFASRKKEALQNKK